MSTTSTSTSTTPTTMSTPSTYTLPTLFYLDSRDKERMWRVWVIGNALHQEYGTVDGKKITNKRLFDGKNKGKKNETSASEQAKIEAEKKWVRKVQQNKYPDKDDVEGQKILKLVLDEHAKTGGYSRNASAKIRGRKTVKLDMKSPNVVKVTKTIKPMLANKWEWEDGSSNVPLKKIKKHFDLAKTDIYVQPKLDGYRCLAFKENNKVILTTRNGKQYPWFKAIREDLKKIFDEEEGKGSEGVGKVWDGGKSESGGGDKKSGEEWDGGKSESGGEGVEKTSKTPKTSGTSKVWCLDGEIYAHTLTVDGKDVEHTAKFSMTQSVCALSQKKPHPQEELFKLHIFDIVDDGKLSQSQRLSLLDKVFDKYDGKFLTKVAVHKIKKYEEIDKLHDVYQKQGYEGVMLRSSECFYKSGRSLHLRKYKKFMDAEYEIVDAEVNYGVSTENFKWVCLDGTSGKKFRATPNGNKKARVVLFKNKKDHIGKLLKVKFQEYTKDGIPRFPVALGFREEWDM